LKELFNDLWSMPDKESAEAFLKQWCEEVENSKRWIRLISAPPLIY
jgi:transposase